MPSIAPLFPTPLFFHDCLDFVSEEWVEWIYSNKDNIKNTDIRSNAGGWQSMRRLWRIPSFLRYYDYFMKEMYSVTDELLISGNQIKLDSMWININGKGHHNLQHNHPNSDLTGVFYIKSNGEESGSIVFANPHSYSDHTLINLLKDKEKLFSDPKISFPPVDGRLFLFPARLSHSVMPNTTDNDRISMSFNLTFARRAYS